MSICIKCSGWNSRVLESRRRPETGWYYRRRECMECNTRWGTLEVPEVDIRTPNPTIQYEDRDDEPDND